MCTVTVYHLNCTDQVRHSARGEEAVQLGGDQVMDQVVNRVGHQPPVVTNIIIIVNPDTQLTSQTSAAGASGPGGHTRGPRHRGGHHRGQSP